MSQIGYLLLMLLPALAPQSVSGQTASSKIAIIDTGVAVREVTTIDAGPATGNMLNIHYFPGIIYFNAGYYSAASAEFEYVVARPQYLEGNPRREEVMSTAHYLHGMIYSYHSEGVGRYTLAKTDFEEAIKWNPNMFRAYLELGQLYSRLGFRPQAIAVLEQLLQLKPDQAVAEETRKFLDMLQRTETKAEQTQTAAVGVTKTGVTKTGVTKTGTSASSENDVAETTTSAASPLGRLAVSAAFAVDIYEGNKFLGATPVTLELTAGQHTLEYRRENLRTSATYTIKADETLTATAAFKNAVLDINAQPWADVYLETSETSLGQTPLSRITVPVGGFLIFRNPSFPEKRYRITGAEKSVSVVFP